MKQILLSMVLLALVFTGCSKEDISITKDLEIILRTEESYRFNENAVSVIEPPKSFVAIVKNNEVKGVHQGVTEMVVKAGNVVYKCKIKVEPAHTFYIDMALYLGKSKASITQLYGDPIKTVENTCLFGPFMEFSPELNNVFAFDVNDKVTMCMIYFPLSNGLSILNHLKDRYAMYNTSDTYKAIMYDSDDPQSANVVVLYEYSKDTISVAYTTKAYLYEQSAKAKSSAGDLEVLSERMRTLISEK